ncbi:fimbrial protein [Dryocola clanedunensis]
MKKNLISMAIAVAAVLSAANTFAEDGTVNFTGEITDTACTVDIGANNTMTVDLGKVARTAFTGVGSKASATKFVLKLKDCPTGLNLARVKFDGTGYDGDDSVLKLTQDLGAAQGVAIELSDPAAKLPLFTPSTAYALVEGDNALNFYARYVQMAQTVVSGPANASATFTLNYN